MYKYTTERRAKMSAGIKKAWERRRALGKDKWSQQAKKRVRAKYATEKSEPKQKIYVYEGKAYKNLEFLLVHLGVKTYQLGE